MCPPRPAQAGSTALHLASGGCPPEAVELLLRRGADVHARDAAWRTPLHVATARAQVRAVGMGAVAFSVRHGTRWLQHMLNPVHILPVP